MNDNDITALAEIQKRRNEFLANMNKFVSQIITVFTKAITTCSEFCEATDERTETELRAQGVSERELCKLRVTRFKSYLQRKCLLEQVSQRLAVFKSHTEQALTGISIEELSVKGSLECDLRTITDAFCNTTHAVLEQAAKLDPSVIAPIVEEFNTELERFGERQQKTVIAVGEVCKSEIHSSAESLVSCVQKHREMSPEALDILSKWCDRIETATATMSKLVA